MDVPDILDAVVVGGGPAGATAATELARAGMRVTLVDRAGRIKPCGGAIPPQAMREFALPESLLVARISSARMIAPSERKVDMRIDDGYVGMVDREVFDEWLRVRAVEHGATRLSGEYVGIARSADGTLEVRVRENGSGRELALPTRVLIGADGAQSKVAEDCIPQRRPRRNVYAYHEIVAVPAEPPAGYDRARCEVWYQGHISPDFYGWVFPHGATASIGVGTARRGFSLRSATASLRRQAGLDGLALCRREGAPIPMKPLAVWDNRRDVVLAGDAAGVVAPASGEGIYYALASGRMAAEASLEALATGDGRALAQARRRFMRAHGRVFAVLGMLQYWWYSNDRRREGFVKMCADPDVQRLTWEAYLNKRLVRGKVGAHFRVMWKDLLTLLGLSPTA